MKIDSNVNTRTGPYDKGIRGPGVETIIGPYSICRRDRRRYRQRKGAPWLQKGKESYGGQQFL